MRLERPGCPGATLGVIVTLVVTLTVAVSPMLVAVGQSGQAATPGEGTPDAPPGGTLVGDTGVETADATVRGGGPDDELGAALAGGGDVDGDGAGDLLVGAPFDDGGANRSGAAYLFSGPLAASERDTAAANVTLRGENRSDRAGQDVALGDLDGDGVDDLVVGAPLHDAAGEDAGAVYVIYGAETLDGEVDLADADVTLVGGAAGDRFGRTVATVPGGDAGTDADAGASDAAETDTADEGDDLLVGAPRADENGTDAGAAYLFDGGDLGDGADGAGVSNASDADATFVGTNAGDSAGVAVSGAGDVNGDGETDLLIGAHRANASDGTAVGAAYVVTAAADGETSLADATLRLVGAGESDAAGAAVAAAGDVDADGYDDVIVGAPFNDSGGPDAGAAYVVRGGPDRSGVVTLSTAEGQYHGERDGDNAGWSVAATGASGGPCDEYADVLVGAPGANDAGADAGAAYLVTGGEEPVASAGGQSAAGAGDGSAAATNLSTASARALGADEGGRAGEAVAGVGDVSGDGNLDVAVGAPLSRDGGAAHVLFGECPVPVPGDGGEVTNPSTPGETGSTTGAPGAPGTSTATDAPRATDAPTATRTATPTGAAAPTPTPAPADTTTPTAAPTETPTPTETPDDQTVVQTGDACYGETGAITVFGDGSSDDPITVTATDEDGGFVGEVVLTTEADSNELTVENGTYSLSAQRSDGRSVPVTQETVTVDCEPVG